MSLFSFLSKNHHPPPPPSFPPSTSTADEPSIPDPAVFTITPLAASTLPLDGAPTVSQCAVHLELLQALSKLRHRVMKEAALIEVFGTVDEEKETWWRAFVEVAVERFGVWWLAVDSEVRSLDEMARGKMQGAVRELPEWLLPPLDVLMVWHSYLLNPRCYNEDALHFGLTAVLNVAFPWALVHSAIDIGEFDYTLPESAVKFFEELTSQSPNLIAELLWKETPPRKHLTCPHCGKDDILVRICDSEKKGGGWMDAEFATTCPGCSTTIDKPLLCTSKFTQDISVFLSKGDAGRMRMTHLDQQGHSPSSDPAADSTNTFFRSQPFTSIPLPTTTTTTTTPTLRRALDVYTTPTLYSTDLAAAVLRQGVFVTKMADQLWLRSPGLIGTLPLDAVAATFKRLPHSIVAVTSPAGFLERAVDRYKRFFLLFAAHPGQMLVPTLDVDLVWHTAMLTAASYRVWCRAAAGRFVDHDDKLGADVLGGGFEFTGKAWGEAYGDEYARCTCWYCEAAVNEGLGREGAGSAWGRMWRGEGRKERGVRVRVEFYREVERKRRARAGGLARAGLEEALKRC